MSILERGLKGIRDFDARIRARRVEGLLKDTANTEKAFISQAKHFGIEVSNFNLRSYYELLGIRYTNDQKAIKAAYISLVKKYHPDVSTDTLATQKTEQINEAYSVLKDKQKKAEYDAKFSKGKNRMSTDTTKILYNELLRRYQDMRNKDFDEFNKRVANPQELNSLRATVEETVNWTARFRQVSNNTFGNFWDYGRKLKHLYSLNKGLIKGEKDETNLNRLSDNLARLEGLVQAFNEADKGIAAVVESAMNDIATEENNLADRLRRSVN